LECGDLSPLSFFFPFELSRQKEKKEKEKKRRQVAALQKPASRTVELVLLR
jgi:hypothetical protein